MNDRSQRWQKTAIDQLTYTLNLFLALTIAVLGYGFSLLRDDEFMQEVAAKCFMLSSFVALAVSTVCGLACVVCRMRDIRGTAQRARVTEGAPSRRELRGLGDWTWRLFYSHVLLFGLGVVLLATTLFRTYGDRLW